MITRRQFGAMSAAAALLPQTRIAALAAETGVVRSHGSSLLGSLHHSPDYPHFDYVNPFAPKGGAARLARIGGFDSFHPFVQKGEPVNVAPWIYETLMERSLDEGSTSYGLLAEWIEHPADYSWVAFGIREGARWHDGRPVEAADVVFTFDSLKRDGFPSLRQYYKDVESARDEGGGVVRFAFSVTGNRELPHIVGELDILPRHWWEGRDFAESTMDRPLGSGPYRIGDFEINRFVEYERVEDHWGAELPVRIGTNNIDRVRFEFFLDAVAAFESFKVGDVDFRAENNSKVWATGYDFPAVRSGAVIKRTYTPDGPKGVQGFLFNGRRPKFADPRTREALALVFDFEWTNETLYFGQYARPWSFFQGTADLMPEGLPQGRELELLESVREHVPEAAFGPPYAPNQTGGSGRIRGELREARTLLESAGWSIQEGSIVDGNGEPLQIEFLTAQAEQERIIGPYLQNVRKLGIQADLRVVDWTQYGNRIDEQDFDMVIWGWRNSESPGNEQRGYWGSSVADVPNTANLGGVRNPGIDALVDRIILADNREALAAACRALDRVLTHSHFAVFQLYTPYERIAYWDRFGHPDPFPSRTDGFPTVWWWDEAKAAATAKL